MNPYQQKKRWKYILIAFCINYCKRIVALHQLFGEEHCPVGAYTGAGLGAEHETDHIIRR